MTLKQIGIISAVMGGFFFAGWICGRHSGINSLARSEIPELSGAIDPLLSSEKTADTIYVPLFAGTSRVPKLVDIESLPEGPARDSAYVTAAVDWNKERIYSGTLFEDKRVGKLSYTFPVQFNKAGGLSYTFEPVAVPKAKARLRPMFGGEIYTNGQYSFGAGVQYGSFALNLRALSTEARNSYAFGIGVQIIF